MTIEHIITQFKTYKPDAGVSKIRGAYNLAKELHKDLRRFSGDPYVEYLLDVLCVLLTLKSDEDTLAATLLQKAVVDNNIPFEDIKDQFGENVGNLLKGLKQLKNMKILVTESKVETLRKMFLAMAADLRVVLIMLAGRLVSMRTLSHVSIEKQNKIARETMDVYVPVASRLGIYTLKSQLEDLAFKYLFPIQFTDITEQMSSFGLEKNVVIDEIKKKLETFLDEKGVKAYVDGRIKGVSSIYRKLKKKNKSSVDEIFDVFAMRIVLTEGKESYEHLYGILGLIHSRWVPLAQRFKDYVAIPKPNGYQSLHTTVLGLSPKEHGQPVEIQIRTERMHKEAELGIASHWLYETGVSPVLGFDRDDFLNHSIRNKGAIDGNIDENFHKRHIDWLKGLEKLQSDVAENYNVDIFNDRIFVLTPQGEVKDLPAAATPIDFAYAVHSDIGHRCAMAKVNNSIVPLDYELKNGEVVEIILKPKPNPKAHWLSFVQTSQAKAKIKSWFNNMNRESNVREGRNMLNRHLQRHGKSALDDSLSILKNYNGKRLTSKDRENILEEVGTGAQLANVIVRKLFPDSVLLSPSAPSKKTSLKRDSDSKSLSVLIGGEAGLPVKIAACCKPTQESAIIAYITRSHVITIHKQSCAYVENLDETRKLDASWGDEMKKPAIKYKVNFMIEAVNRLGLVRDIAAVIASCDANIIDFAMIPNDREGMFCRIATIEVVNLDQFDKILDKVERVKNVLRVERRV